MKPRVLQCDPLQSFVPLSWAIKEIQGTNYSHYAIQFGNIIIDVRGKGFNIYPSYEFHKLYNIVGDYEMPFSIEPLQFLNWISAYSVVTYGAMQLLGNMLILLKMVKTNPFGSGKEKLTCCELVVYMLRDFCSDMELRDTDDYDLLSTEELLMEII